MQDKLLTNYYELLLKNDVLLISQLTVYFEIHDMREIMNIQEILLLKEKKYLEVNFHKQKISKMLSMKIQLDHENFLVTYLKEYS